MIEKKVFHIICNIISCNENNINKNDIRYDSLQLISIVANIEEEFNIIFEPEEFTELKDIDSIVKIIEKKLK